MINGIRIAHMHALNFIYSCGGNTAVKIPTYHEHVCESFIQRAEYEAWCVFGIVSMELLISFYFMRMLHIKQQPESHYPYTDLFYANVFC